MTAVRLLGAGRSYALYARPLDRLLEVVTKRERHRSVKALSPTDLHIPRGQVLGVVGNNGAGKSTLLKLIAGTLAPSVGRVELFGSVGGLLELGGGFHPDMTGRENVFLKGAILGLDRDAMRERFSEIVDFADLGDFIEQPVKTYSSGMFMRLAFAVATCVEPDILLIDEALSVGDGKFARKSFERIMRFKETGRTILFCSHSLYQVEAICDRVIWLHHGEVRRDGDPSDVIAEYTSYMNTDALEARAEGETPVASSGDPVIEPVSDRSESAADGSGTARILKTTVSVDGLTGQRLAVRSGHSEVCVEVEFVSDLRLPTPTVAVTITQMDGRIVSSAASQHDGILLERDDQGRAAIRVCFPGIPILKGVYGVNAYLLCEQAVHFYEYATMVAEINVMQSGLAQGIVALEHHWERRGGSEVKRA